jgi:multiple sugar transport system permease protein
MMGKRGSNAIVYIVLGLCGALALLPFAWMLVSSFKSNAEIASATPSFFPHAFSMKNYSQVFKKFNFLGYIGNSLFVAALKTAVVAYTSALCGYVFAKYRFRGKEILFGLVLGTMMIPWPVTIIPMYDFMSKLRWTNSYASLVVPGVLSSFGIFMMRQFIAGIPDSLIEAARIDGAHEVYILHRIIAPLSVNAISSIAIFTFLWSWEDFLWPYLMISDEARQLLPIALKNFNGRYYTNFGGLFAATTLSILPVLIVYLFFQRQFIAGVTVAGVKE